LVAPALAIALLAAAGGAGCTKRNPAYCGSDLDCPSGTRCNLVGSPGKNTCVTQLPGDGGPDGTDAKETGDASGDASDGPRDAGGDGDAGGKTGCTGNGDCADGGAHVCDVDAGMCVGCLARGDCSGATPACDTAARKCVGCVAAGDCSGTKPACDTVAQVCVECLATADCSFDPTRPICDTASKTCGKCSSDSQCAAKLGANPGVCMAHEDGRCATDGETVYVESSASCSDAAGATGTAAHPLCSMTPVPTLLSTTRDLVLVRGTVTAGGWTFTGIGAAETSIVGQSSGFIAAAMTPGFAMTGGQIYLRGLTISASAAICINATGGTLRLDGVTVDTCKKGGIFIDGSAFDIRNTTITNNGPGTLNTTSWGGVLVNSLPASGPDKLTLVTIQDNKQVGLTCSAAIQGTGVLASGNAGGVDINPTCGVTACTPASATCGAP
jgi:hypothetical protein